MKRLLIAFILLSFSSIALAKGSLTLKPGVDVKTGERQSLMGLSVYQQIPPAYVGGLKLGYNGWLGGEIYERDHESNWVKADSSVETYVGPMAFGVGGYIDHKPYQQDLDERVVYASFKMTLWQ
jgi:hypothetical protein